MIIILQNLPKNAKASLCGLMQFPAVAMSCIAIIQCRTQKIAISMNHRTYLDFISFMHIHLSVCLEFPAVWPYCVCSHMTTNKSGCCSITLRPSIKQVLLYKLTIHSYTTTIILQKPPMSNFHNFVIRECYIGTGKTIQGLKYLLSILCWPQL